MFDEHECCDAVACLLVASGGCVEERLDELKVDLLDPEGFNGCEGLLCKEPLRRGDDFEFAGEGQAAGGEGVDELHEALGVFARVAAEEAGGYGEDGDYLVGGGGLLRWGGEIGDGGGELLFEGGDDWLDGFQFVFVGEDAQDGS